MQRPQDNPSGKTLGRRLAKPGSDEATRTPWTASSIGDTVLRVCTSGIFIVSGLGHFMRPERVLPKLSHSPVAAWLEQFVAADTHALLTLSEAASPISVSTLARTVNIDRTNVSRLCGRMEDLGEVERLPNPSHGRSKLLQLTNNGQELADHVDAASAQHFATVVDALGEQAPFVLNALILLADALLDIESNPKTKRKRKAR